MTAGTGSGSSCPRALLAPAATPSESKPGALACRRPQSFQALPADSRSSWAGVLFALEDPVVGRIERVCDGVVSGWACRPDDAGARTAVRVIVDGVAVATARADLDRPELAAAALRDGHCGFQIALPVELASEPSHGLRIETTDGTPIPASASFVTVTERSGELWRGVDFHVPGAVIGRVQKASDGIVSGWAYRSGAPQWRVWVQVIVDGAGAYSGVAELERPELAAELGDGRHGFSFELPTAAAGHCQVLVEAEGIALAPAAR